MISEEEVEPKPCNVCGNRVSLLGNDSIVLYRYESAKLVTIWMHETCEQRLHTALQHNGGTNYD